jgi:hypothetical protein
MTPDIPDASSGGGGFDAVVGARRGVSAHDAVVAQLTQVTAELAQANERLAQRQHEFMAAAAAMADLRESLRRAEARVDENQAERAYSAQALVVYRYRLLRAGERDVNLPHLGAVGVHTPGRPYLSGEHAFSQRLGRCYVARPGGVFVGETPGKSSRWQRCREHLAGVMPTNDMRSSRQRVRQQTYWWGDSPRCLIRELGDTQLGDVITYLRIHAPDLYAKEEAKHPFSQPCPVVAYPDAGRWMNDTPLMRTLLAERRRRGRRSAAEESRHD